MSRLANTLPPLASSKFRSASTHTFNAFLSILFRFPYLSDNFFFIVGFFKANLSERALELLALPDDGVPRLLLDIGLCLCLCLCLCFVFLCL